MSRSVPGVRRAVTAGGAAVGAQIHPQGDGPRHSGWNGGARRVTVRENYFFRPSMMLLNFSLGRMTPAVLASSGW